MIEEKKKLRTYIIEKLFCHHQMETLCELDLQNRNGEIISKKLVRECKLCGKNKVITL